MRRRVPIRIPVITCLLAAVVSLGCSDRGLTSASQDGIADSSTPVFVLSDGAHSGQQGFYFLPPLLPDPGPFSGTFDPLLEPTVTVCALVPATPSGFTCGSTIKTFSSGAGPGDITVNEADESYKATWNTRNNPAGLQLGANKYRLEVYVGTQRLGFADLWFVAKTRDLKDVGAAYIGLVKNTVFPIKFRIETGIAGEVIVSPATATVAPAATQQFAATVKDLHGATIADPVLTWNSSSTGIATVDATGLATGVAAGTATITATAQQVSGSASLTVAGGLTWTRVATGLTVVDLRDVWASSATDVFVVGGDGKILHFDGSSWSTMSSGTTNHLMGVWGTSSSDVFAVGLNGTILHYNGTAWSTMSSGVATGYLYRVWGSSPTDVFVTGESGRILHYDGTSWSPMTSGTTVALYSVFGAGAANVYAVGASGTVLHYDGTSWSALTSSTTANLLAVLALQPPQSILPTPPIVLVAGDGGIIRRYDGSTWSDLVSNTTQPLLDLCGRGRDAFAAGAAGTIQRYATDAWTSVWSGTPPYTNTLRGNWCNTSRDIYVVGDNGLILHGVDNTPVPE